MATPPVATICELSGSAITTLANLKTQIASDVERSDLELAIEDAIGRLQLWTGNIGALQPANSPKSLDFRLRDAYQIKGNVQSALERLVTIANIASSILTGELPNRLDVGEESGTTPLPDELHQLVESIKSSLDTLFRLSMLVRRHRPRGRHSGDIGLGDDDTPPGDPLDTRHVCDLFPQVKGKPWLAARLGKAMSVRRDYLQSRQTHRKSLAKPTRGDSVAADTGTIATTFVDDKDGQHKSKEKACSVFTAATSFQSVGDNGQVVGQAVPDLSDMSLDGVQLNYGDPFECPYCRTIQQVSNRAEWKKHVFFDLQPYVCSFEDCKSGLFGSRHEWWQHEMDCHRRKWRCTLCPPSSAPLGGKHFTEAHLKTHHSNLITEAQMPFVLSTFRDPASHVENACPLCPVWPAEGQTRDDGGKELARHLAQHMQQLAQAALQLRIDGLVIHEPDVEEPESEVEQPNSLREWHQLFEQRQRKRDEMLATNRSNSQAGSRSTLNDDDLLKFHGDDQDGANPRPSVSYDDFVGSSSTANPSTRQPLPGAPSARGPYLPAVARDLGDYQRYVDDYDDLPDGDWYFQHSDDNPTGNTSAEARSNSRERKSVLRLGGGFLGRVKNRLGMEQSYAEMDLPLTEPRGRDGRTI